MDTASQRRQRTLQARHGRPPVLGTFHGAGEVGEGLLVGGDEGLHGLQMSHHLNPTATTVSWTTRIAHTVVLQGTYMC